MIQAEDALGFVGKAKYLPSPTVESVESSVIQIEHSSTLGVI